MSPNIFWAAAGAMACTWGRAAEVVAADDVFFCIGTSSLVEPAASLPEYACSSGGPLVQINPEATSHDRIAHHILRGKAGEILPALLHAAWPGAL